MDHTSTQWQVTQTLSLVYTRYAIMATVTIVILEYFHHIDVEKSLIWSSRWNLTKALFIISRYFPFEFVTLFFYYNSAPNSTSPKTCQSLFGAGSVSLVTACLCADAVLYLRLYALSKQARTTKIVLIANYTLVTLICLTGISLFLRSETFVPSPDLLPMTPCFHWGKRATTLWLTVCYGALLYSSLFTTALSLYYGIKLYIAMQPMPSSTLIKIFHRDGAVYFLCIATISLTNASIGLFAPLEYRYVLSIPQGMIHSVLATRMILHLREAANDSMLQATSLTRVPGSTNIWDITSTTDGLSLRGPASPKGGRPYPLQLSIGSKS